MLLALEYDVDIIAVSLTAPADTSLVGFQVPFRQDRADTKRGGGVCIQYCRVPKNGLQKNGQAGISSKNKNEPRLEKELRTVSPHSNSVCYEDDSFGGFTDLETSPLRARQFFFFLKHFTCIQGPRPWCVVTYRVHAAS